jgi:hypothetical protein
LFAKVGGTRGGATRPTIAVLPCRGIQKFVIRWREKSAAIWGLTNRENLF